MPRRKVLREEVRFNVKPGIPETLHVFGANQPSGDAGHDLAGNAEKVRFKFRDRQKLTDTMTSVN